MEQTKHLIITINRQLGSGGAYIGQELAKKLNFYYADREIVSKAASQLSASSENLNSYDEKLPSLWDYFLANSVIAPGVYIPPQIVLPPTSRELYEVEKEIIQHIAQKGSAVIIGRCGFNVFCEHTNSIKIFLHSSQNFRIQRVSELYNVSEETAVKMIDKSDRERASYCKTFTGKEWVNTTNYDISINTGKIGVDKTIDFILDYLKQVKLS